MADDHDVLIEAAQYGIVVRLRAATLAEHVYKIDHRDDHQWTVLVREDLDPARRREVLDRACGTLRRLLRAHRRRMLTPVAELVSDELGAEADAESARPLAMVVR